MKPQIKTALTWVFIFLVVLLVASRFMTSKDDELVENFGALIHSLEQGEIAKIEVQNSAEGYIFTGTYKESDKEFRTHGTLTDSIVKTLQKAYNEHKTDVVYKPHEDNGFLILFMQWIPLILIAFVFMFFMRQMQSGGGGRANGFGKSRAKLVDENNNKITFKDVAGIEESKEDLEEIVDFLKDPKKFTRLGGRIPKGVILFGRPGTGKTLLAKAVAGEAGVPFFSIAGSDFVEMFVGVGASRVRDLFEQGKKNAPCIIFIDEIDAVGRQRGAGMGGGHDEREQTLNQLLVEMDGFEANDGVIIIAATNRPDVLDSALLRPGRFDRRVMVPLPDISGREKIFKVHARKLPLAMDVSMGILARSTPGMSGAEIENVTNEAALIAARKDMNKVDMNCFELAKDKIMMGAERRSMIMNEKDLERTSYHEAGHALVTELMESEKDPVHKLTIIPRGQALGLTMFLPVERTTYTKTFAENNIAGLMGGRLAEEIVFGEYNSGASNDIERATSLAKAMVCEWGMSPLLGPLAYGKKEGEVFLGRDFGRTSDFSQETTHLIDSEMKRIVSEQYERARKLLKDNIETLHALAKAVLKYETLEREDIDTILRGDEILRDEPLVRIKTREAIDRKLKEQEQKNVSEQMDDAALGTA